MKNFMVKCCLVLILLMFVGCSANQGIRTEGIIAEKQVRQDNQYYFIVDYKIEGMEGEFQLLTKVNKSTFVRYSVGDLYIFYRPSSK